MMLASNAAFLMVIIPSAVFFGLGLTGFSGGLNKVCSPGLRCLVRPPFLLRPSIFCPYECAPASLALCHLLAMLPARCLSATQHDLLRLLPLGSFRPLPLVLILECGLGPARLARTIPVDAHLIAHA